MGPAHTAGAGPVGVCGGRVAWVGTRDDRAVVVRQRRCRRWSGAAAGACEGVRVCGCGLGTTVSSSYDSGDVAGGRVPLPARARGCGCGLETTVSSWCDIGGVAGGRVQPPASARGDGAVVARQRPCRSPEIMATVMEDVERRWGASTTPRGRSACGTGRSRRCDRNGRRILVVTTDERRGAGRTRTAPPGRWSRQRPAVVITRRSPPARSCGRGRSRRGARAPCRRGGCRRRGPRTPTAPSCAGP